MRPRSILTATLAFSLTTAIATAIAYAQDTSSLVRPAMISTVQQTDAAFARTYPAIVRPSQEAELSFRVSGRIIELPVRAPDQIRQGDVIAQLDPRDFEAQVSQLQGQLDQGNAQLQALRSGARDEEVAALEAAVEAAAAQADQARDQVERTTQLAERGVVSTAQLDQEEASLRVAEAQLRSTREELSIGTSGGRAEDVAAAEAALRVIESQLQAAQDNLDDATLRAPFDGFIARRDVENFTNIQAGQDIVLIQKLSTVHLAFDVPGPDVTTFAVSDDNQLEVVFNALPNERFTAEMVEFSIEADTATQTYRGRVAVQLPELTPIFPGMVASVFASTQLNGPQSLSIPLSAVAALADGSPAAWIVDPSDNSVRRVSVTLGDVSGPNVEVREGLSAGDSVVSAGVTRLEEGMTIRPITRVGG